MEERQHEAKREKLTREQNRISLWTIPLVALGAFLVLLGSWEEPWNIHQEMQKIHYENLGKVAMSKVEGIVGNGRIEVPLDVVKERKLVSFEYQSEEGRTPLLAYITPSGKVVTAVSTCEPCNSNRFHIEGNELVCDNCLTRWRLETLKGISGGCIAYPPDILFHTVDGGKLMIKEIDVQNWKPRFLRG